MLLCQVDVLSLVFVQKAELKMGSSLDVLRESQVQPENGAQATDCRQNAGWVDFEAGLVRTGLDETVRQSKKSHVTNK